MSDSTTNSAIYLIRNTKNGNFYLGQTQNIQRRWSRHRTSLRGNYHRNRHLQRAWNKYGEAAFKFLVLEYCPIEQLNEREQHYLDRYVDCDNCYNLAKDASSNMRGLTHSEETRRKISWSTSGKNNHNFGKPMSAVQRRKISAAHSGKVLTEEHRHKLSESHKGNRHSDEQRRKMSESLRGRVVSEETRHKISIAQKGKVVSEESRNKMSESHKGKTLSEEHRRKIADSMKRYRALQRTTAENEKSKTG